MSVIATAVKHLLAAGVTGDALVSAIAEMEDSQPKDLAAERRRAWDRERKRAKKADNSTGIPPESAESAEQVETPPALDKETSPRPPKEINPTPRATRAGALARKAGGFGPPIGVDLNTWNAFCSQRKKPLSQIAYDRMLTTLAECADVGWPPGEIVERSIEKTWETLYVPSERKNGSRPANDRNREQPENPWVAGLRQAEAREAH